MAETLRWPGSLKKHLANIEKKRHKEPVFFKIFPILAVGLITCFLTQLYFKNTELTLSLFLLGSFFVVLILLGWKLWQTNIESEKLLKGLNGEELVANLLDKLPEEWLIVNDLKINGAQIDHIAIGPAGIICLETKNWNNAGCDEDGNWYRFHLGHWVPVSASTAEQNADHVFSLKNYLMKELGLDIKICSIVVMANPRAKLNIKAKVVPPGDTRICLPHELHHVILNNQGAKLTPDEARDIAETLVKH